MGKTLLSDKAIFLSASEKRKNEYVLTHSWFSGGKFSIYSFFRGEISVYTHFSGGKTQYILIFRGEK
jgi:hypothetical protein